MAISRVGQSSPQVFELSDGDEEHLVHSTGVGIVVRPLLAFRVSLRRGEQSGEDSSVVDRLDAQAGTGAERCHPPGRL